MKSRVPIGLRWQRRRTNDVPLLLELDNQWQTDGVAPCVAAGRVLQRLSFFAVFIAFSLTVLVMSYTIFCVVAPGTQRSIFRVFARLKFAR